MFNDEKIGFRLLAFNASMWLATQFLRLALASAYRKPDTNIEVHAEIRISDKQP